MKPKHIHTPLQSKHKYVASHFPVHETHNRNYQNAISITHHMEGRNYRRPDRKGCYMIGVRIKGIFMEEKENKPRLVVKQPIS